MRAHKVGLYVIAKIYMYFMCTRRTASIWRCTQTHTMAQRRDVAMCTKLRSHVLWIYRARQHCRLHMHGICPYCSAFEVATGGMACKPGRVVRTQFRRPDIAVNLLELFGLIILAEYTMATLFVSVRFLWPSMFALESGDVLIAVRKV